MSKIHKAKKINQSKGQNPRPTIGYMVHAEAPDILQAGILGASDASDEMLAHPTSSTRNGIHEP